jgi:hypothetical protein
MTDNRALDLVDDALDNLVNQFARPLDFLRELVQNSIDAGTPRVDIWIGWNADSKQPGKGVIEIHVVDHGEGMDEEIIDRQLTRMFASTKEDDLTKIGKFGIGFTSVFAIRPDAVLLRTGRHGQSWELLFHADRTFDKTRCEEPMEGTRITLYKSIREHDLDSMIRDCRWTLGYWCEHSDIPVTFADRTKDDAQQASSSGDAFSAFARPQRETSAEVVTTPLSLDSSIQTEHRREGIQVVIGYSDQPRYGFYNSGLTLVNTRSPDVLGDSSSRLAHLDIKVKSQHLEHTLTRDNVLQDAHWELTMTQVRVAADTLRNTLLDQIEACRERTTLLQLLELLTLEASAAPFDDIDTIHKRVFFPLLVGGFVSLEAIEEQESKEGCVLIGCDSAALASSLSAAGVLVLMRHPSTEAALAALTRSSFFGGETRPRHLFYAEEVYVLPELLELEQMDAPSLSLLQKTEELLCHATREKIQLRLGELGSRMGTAKSLAMEGPNDGRLFRRGGKQARSRGLWSGERCLLVDRRHPSWQSYHSAWIRDPVLAAAGLAQLLLSDEGASHSGEFERLFEQALHHEARS